MTDQRFSRGRQDLTRRKMRGAELIWLFAIGFLLVLPMLWIASVRTDLINYGYKVESMRIHQAKLEVERDMLRAELAHLKRPEHVFSSLKKAGFVPSRRQVIVYTTTESMIADARQPGE